MTHRFEVLLLLLFGACRPTAAHPPATIPVAPDLETRAQDNDDPIRVAITVDDLPAHGPVPPDVTRLSLHQRMLEAFAVHQAPRVYGFVNAARAADAPDHLAALHAWVDAGHPLGNHTFSHPRMQDLDLSAYLAEIDGNEPLLAELVHDPSVYRKFRYPFLIEGTSEATTLAVREHLRSRGYRVAEVTIDFFDWAFNPPYVRCLSLGDDEAVTRLRGLFLDHALRMLQWSDAAAKQMYGRAIPHVLLLHVGAFGAEMMAPLLTAYERSGVEWITLDEALADPVYLDVPIEPGVTQGTLLDLMIEARGVAHPPRPIQPTAELDAMCRSASSAPRD